MAEGDRSTFDVIKENTSKVMSKMDSQIPLYVKMHSDVYRRYRHMMDDFFDAGYALERAELDLLFQNDGTRRAAETATRFYSNTMLANLSMYGEFLKWYAHAQRANMRAIDSIYHGFLKSLGAEPDEAAGEPAGSTSPPDKPAAKPAGQAKPAKPTRPTRQAKPAKPAKPAGQAKPTRPTRQAKPAKPAKPAGQAKPTRPTRQAKPAKPAKPAGQAKPTRPTRQARPAKPAKRSRRTASR